MLTLLATPVVYSLFDDLSHARRRPHSRSRAHGPPASMSKQPQLADAPVPTALSRSDEGFVTAGRAAGSANSAAVVVTGVDWQLRTAAMATTTQLRPACLAANSRVVGTAD
jgi:hypothetical protein